MRVRPTRRPPPQAMPEVDVHRILSQATAAVASGQAERALALLAPEVLEAVDRVPVATGEEMALAVAGVFHQARRLDLAERYYLRALDARPNVSAYVNLGHLCHLMGRLPEAIEWRQKAMALCPGDVSLGADLATSLIFMGRKDEGMDLLRAAADAFGDRAVHSTVLMNLHYLESLDLQSLFTEHRRWAQAHAPARWARSGHANDRDPDRRLRIGYLSPDFCTHRVAYFFEPLLEAHDRTAVEVFGYGQVDSPDQTSWRLQARFDAYRNVCGLDDQAVVTLIENDRIDVLVDLAGHAGGNRLDVLAHKPAPIQVTYLGYPDTTGMGQVDYRLTDELSTPRALQPFYTEELVYLPDGFLCYRPPDWAPQVPPLPALCNGYVTFGSFNDSCKVNGPLMSLWARIMAANPGSRLVFKSRAGADPQARRIFLDQFREAGVPPDRVVIKGQEPAIESLRLYHQVDIALDAFPYNGTTTTCEALWMGVPVVSLVGQHHASRVGLSILSRVGLESLAALTPDDYVAKATALAQDEQALEKIRASLRPRMMASPLRNGKALARAVESAYRGMWQKWCRARAGCE